MNWVTAELLSVIGILVGVAGFTLAFVTYRFTRRRKLKALYSVRWKNSRRLRPKDVMGIRGNVKHGFDRYFYPRDQVAEVQERIAEGKDVLVVGNPLAGKTRTIFEALYNMRPSCDITVAKASDVSSEDLRLPFRWTEWRKGILVVDDLHQFVGKPTFDQILEMFIHKGYIIVATCRAGSELKKATVTMERLSPSLLENQVEIGQVEPEEAAIIARDSKREPPEGFDGNIGSIFLRLKTMRRRYAECGDKAQAVLHSLKRLHRAGLYREKDLFPVDWVKQVCEKQEGLTCEEYQWGPIVGKLEDDGFLRKSKDVLQAEEVYLEKIVSIDSTLLKNFQQMHDCFDGDPEALYKIADTADDALYTDENQEEYVQIKRLAVAVATRAVEHLTDPKQAERRASALSLLGTAYVGLADIENKDTNCRAAIGAYQAALEVYTRDRYPTHYAMTQNNLGISYGTLALVEDKAANCRKAIEAFQAALEVYTRDHFPMDYAMTQNNIGLSYGTLALVEDKAANCRKAIAAYQVALEVYTRDRFPMHYATTQNNLGIAYHNLGYVENKAANCRKAIEAYQAALEVSTRDRFPMDYAMTQNNLGNAYNTLSEVEDKAANCRKAIEAYQAALEVYTRDHFPIQYAATQNNLGIAYRNLGEVEDKAANCQKAIDAFQAALEVRTRDLFPMDYAMTQNNLGVAYRILSEIEDKAANCMRAGEAYQLALEVYREQGLKQDCQGVEHNLELLADLRDDSD